MSPPVGSPGPARADAPEPGVAWVDVPPGKAATWTLVLDAEGIPYRIVQRPDGVSLSVRTADMQAALEAIAAFERENPVPENHAANDRPFGQLYVGLIAAACLVVGYALAPPTPLPDTAFDRGAALAGAIAHGEIYRTVTALTLHADLGHLVSNMAAIVLFGALLASVVGPGAALALMVLSGAAGNWLDALVQPAAHASVGASTAIFGAVGCLVGIQLTGGHPGARRWGRLWAPLAAGVVLLALFGTGQHSDVAAHVLGFVSGLGIGGAVGLRAGWLGGRARQTALAALAALAVAISWWLALR